MLTDSQKQQFERHGFTRVPNAFSVADAMPMQTCIWLELERQCGVDRDDPSTWHSDVWPKFSDIKFDPVFDPIGKIKTRVALDEMLGEWEEPSNWGQFIVSFPKPDEEWEVPHHLWHTDFGFDEPVDPLRGALLISFITDVGPRSAGTGFVAGSHKLVEKFVDSKPPEFLDKMRRVREAFMVSDPWLVDLSNPALTDREERFMCKESIVDGCPLKVVDLTGNTGDIVIAHPWLFHASSKNCGTSVSMRRVQRVKTR